MGKVHSFETFGNVDGPGTRLVIFLSGCHLRCKFCHNPDTWDINSGSEFSAKEVVDKFIRNKEFYEDGGITLSGGDPLFQPEFVLDIFKLAKENNIHTCLDTSGYGLNVALNNEILKYTDLVMLDIKHTDKNFHKDYVKGDLNKVISFLDLCSKMNKGVLLRYVLVNGVSDSIENLESLADLVSKYDNVKIIQILPYHKHGIIKYEKLGIPDPLDGIEATSKKSVEEAKDVIRRRLSIYGKEKNYI